MGSACRFFKKRQCLYKHDTTHHVNVVSNENPDADIDFAKYDPTMIGQVFMLKRSHDQVDVEGTRAMRTGDQVKWLLDSGATTHVLDNIAMLHNVTHEEHGGKVSVAMT